MHEYDIALKSILTRRTGTLLTRLTGLEVARWHNTEFPEVRSRRADLLGETLQGNSRMWNCKAPTMSRWLNACWNTQRRFTGPLGASRISWFYMWARRRFVWGPIFRDPESSMTSPFAISANSTASHCSKVRIWATI